MLLNSKVLVFLLHPSPPMLLCTSVDINAHRDLLRQSIQNERARAIAEQRGRNRVTQLIVAATQMRNKVSSHIKAEEEKLARQKEEEKRLDQFLISIKAGEITLTQLAAGYVKKMKGRLKKKVSHTTEADRHYIRELAEDYTQAEMALKTGFAQSTVSNVLNFKVGVKNQEVHRRDGTSCWSISLSVSSKKL